MSASTLRSTSICASDSPFITRLYDSPLPRAVERSDPETTALALTHAAVAKRILTGFDDGLLRGAKNFTSRVVVALRLIEDLAVACLGGNASFYSSHLRLLKRTAEDDEGLR